MCLCVRLLTVNAQILEAESTPETPFIPIYIKRKSDSGTAQCV